MVGAATLLWIAMIVAAGIIAESKGRSAEKWLLATFLLGPLAFIVLLRADSVPPPAPRPKLHFEVEITLHLCPTCNALIPLGATACPSCASAIG